MRVIFSRKGFDAGSGGCASPIVEGVCISLPIPTRMPTPIAYADLRGPHAELIEDLTCGRVRADQPCHLDPDLAPSLLERSPGWRGALGQTGAAQGHLRRQGVTEGDLFFFWGSFRPVRQRCRWTFDGPSEHRLFGWLQIGTILDLGCDGSHAVERAPWLADHPHTRPGWSQQNTLYIAASELRLGGRSTGLSGWGSFKSGYRLTAEQHGAGRLASRWLAPAWLNPLRGGIGMSFHDSTERWGEDTVRVASRGQEFVANVKSCQAALDWIEQIVGSA